MILIEHGGHATRWTNWLRTVLLAVAGAVILVLAFFFLAVAIVTGIALASVLGLRWWWRTRQLRQRTARHSVLEGEYQVIERREDRPDR